MFNTLKNIGIVVLSVIVVFAGILLPGRQAGAAPNLALDAKGGKEKPYLNANLSPNDNLLWSIEKQSDSYIRIISKVNNGALDANGGKGEPYLNANLEPNDNLLWKLEKHGQFVMIYPKVNLKVVLDANGGKGKNPYLHPEPNSKNANHLWMLVKEKNSNFYRIYSKVEASE